MKKRSERLLKIMDSSLGVILAEILRLRPPKEEKLTAIRNVLFVRPGGIGDAVLLCPAMRKAKELLNAQIDVLAERRNMEAFGLCPVVRRVYTYDEDLEVLKALLKQYDLIIDTEQWYRLSAIFTRFARGKLTVGFSTNNRRKLFHKTVAYEINKHESFNFLRLTASAVGLNLSPHLDIPFLDVPAPYRRWAYALFRKQKADGIPLIAIFPGSAKKEKTWNPEKFAELSRRLEKKGAKIITVGGIADRKATSRIIALLREPMDFSGLTNLAQTAALIEQADLFISVDSGLMHIAFGLGTPTVSLFGPGNSLKWAPQGELHRVVRHSFPCSPCSLFGKIPRCPYNYRCMNSIEVKEVEDAALSILRKMKWKKPSSLKA